VLPLPEQRPAKAGAHLEIGRIEGQHAASHALGLRMARVSRCRGSAVAGGGNRPGRRYVPLRAPICRASFASYRSSSDSSGSRNEQVVRSRSSEARLRKPARGRPASRIVGSSLEQGARRQRR
jgi:hypothetical protein